MENPVSRGNVDWEITRQTIGRIQEINPAFTSDNCLIGGSAAWFYRTLLEKENDPDFPAVAYTPEEEAIWYSQDVDFIGTKRENYPSELQTEPEGSPPIVRINGVWVDTPDEGLFLTRNEASKTAVEAENPITGNSFQIASPILLYREKKTLLQEKNRPQDILHLKTFRQASKLLLCKLAEDATLNQKQAGLLFKLLKEAENIAPELLEDNQLFMRLSHQMEHLEKSPRTRATYHLLKNQILKIHKL